MCIIFFPLLVLFFSNPTLCPRLESTKPSTLDAPAQQQETSPNPPLACPSALAVSDQTLETINPSGLDVMPFLKVAFYDMDGDGRLEMIAGNKTGRLTLFRSQDYQHWQRDDTYFQDVTVGAFSAPAIGDLNGDGQPELVIGTGGFSSNSGRILVFRNTATPAVPRWQPAKALEVDVGDDAAPAILDYNLDGKPDVVLGNSEGRLFFYRNQGGMHFTPEAPPLPLKRSFGMYAAPGGMTLHNRALLGVGESMGKVVLFEFHRLGKLVSLRTVPVSFNLRRFPSPAFASLVHSERVDLVLSDGDGGLEYLDQSSSDFSLWRKNKNIFQNRLTCAPACAPTISTLGGKTFLIIGGIDGTVSAYEPGVGPGGIPWVLKKGYFTGVKVTGFSRAMLAEWQGKTMLVVGQSNGGIRAFLNAGTKQLQRWVEFPRFFQAIKIPEHTTPQLFDLDGDGQWEIVSGAADGRLTAWRVRMTKNTPPFWEDIPGYFDGVKVGRYSTPSLLRSGGRLFLFVGQQDGRIRAFCALEPASGNKPAFTEIPLQPEISGHLHSSPYSVLKDEKIELMVGDYDGILKVYKVEIK